MYSKDEPKILKNITKDTRKYYTCTYCRKGV